MKTITKLVLSFCMIGFSINTYSQIKVLSNGNVGVGNSNPTYKLDVAGSIRGGNMQWSNWTNVMLDWSGLCSSPVIYPSSDWYLQLGTSSNKLGNIFTYCIHSNAYWTDSDIKLKKNINKIDSSLIKIKLINGVTYNFKDEYLPKISGNNKKVLEQTNLGFIAQDVAKVFPELVKHDSLDHYYVNYIGFIPVLLEAIKQQQSQIDSLNLLINKKPSSSLKSATSILSNDSIINKSTDISLNGVAILSQNAPNPFSQSTTIGYYLPETISKATIYVYDMNGIQLKSFQISSKGNGSIIINGYELRPGMYLYALIADGQEIATRRMILTQ